MNKKNDDAYNNNDHDTSTNEHIPKKKKNDAVKVLEEEDAPIINDFLIDATTINKYKNKVSWS